MVNKVAAFKASFSLCDIMESCVEILTDMVNKTRKI